MVVNAIAYGITVFLLLPTVLIVPMSFGPDQFLRFPPSGFTLHWYSAYFADADWIDATLFSVTSLTFGHNVSDDLYADVDASHAFDLKGK